MFNNPFMMGFPQQQPIQTMQTQPQASCFFVKSPADLAGVNVMPNVFYVGLSPDNKEIYVRKMNNDGNIELETYALKAEQKQKTELQTIAERLEAIEKRLSTMPTQRPILTVKGKDSERTIKPTYE